MDAAPQIRVFCALCNAVSEDDEHSRHLINASVQARIVGRGQYSEIMRKKDVIIEFTHGTQGNR